MLAFVPSLDLEGRSDDKIRIMEAVEELRTKRADKQVRAVSVMDEGLLSFFSILYVVHNFIMLDSLKLL